MPTSLLTALLKHKRISIFSHKRPDGDCIGAQVGLALWLQKKGIEVKAFNNDGVPEYLAFIGDYFPIEAIDDQMAFIQSSEVYLVVDGNKADRFPGFEDLLEKEPKPVYMLDHHPQPDTIFEAMYSDPSKSSSCEMAYDLIAADDADLIDEPIAKALYTGIVTDTGSHAFDSVSGATLRASADLMERGNFKPNVINEQIYMNKSLNQIHLLGKALETLQIHNEGKIATICITQSMYEQTQTQSEDTEGIVSYPLSVAGVEAAIMFKEVEDGVKMSLRSKSDIDVNIWARKINGGGHKKAAGAFLAMPLQEAIQTALEAGNDQLS